MKQKGKPGRAEAYTSPPPPSPPLAAMKLSAAVICMHSIPIGNK